ncbi:MAG: sulfatase [Planctomycetaceae bacterium]
MWILRTHIFQRRQPAIMPVALTVILQFALLSTATHCASAEELRPNIVLILADDLGWTDPACFGSRYYETPNIDRLCRDGMKFTNAYSNGPNCAPTRACLMTGRYGPRHGVYTVGSGERGDEKRRKMIPVKNQTNLPLSEVTLADALRAAGYATGCFGKWHLGNGPEYAPGKRGFDVVAARSDATPHPATEYLTSEATGFIRKNANRPFFAYVPYHAVHTPISAPQPLIEKYKAKPAAGGHQHPDYAAMLEELDRGIGRILATLDELDLTKNTLVIFTSDNGGVGGYAGAGIRRRPGRENTDNAPLRGGKGMLYEGGIRVPLIMRWPGHIAAGSNCDEPVISLDYFPTLLEIAGAKANAKHHLDGVSLLPLLEQPRGQKIADRALYWHFPGYLEAGPNSDSWRTTPAGAIRHGDWKLVEFFETGTVELYNLREDIGETNNLAGSSPERAQALHAELDSWRKAVGAPMPRLKAASQTSRGNR